MTIYAFIVVGLGAAIGACRNNARHLLIKVIQQDAFKGVGKPEPLKHSLSGYWSRRINDEHRMVYKAVGGDLYIAQLWYHY